MKAGDKVVCIFKGHEAPIEPNNPVPVYNEIYTVRDPNPKTALSIHSGLYITLMEFSDDYGFMKKFFRPIDYTFGKEVAEKIESEMIPETVEV